MKKGKKKKELDTTPVRIKKDLLDRVKKHIDGTGMTISGFINVSVEQSIKVGNGKQD